MARRSPRILLSLMTVALISSTTPGGSYALAAEESPMVKALLDGMAKKAKNLRPAYASLEVNGTTSVLHDVTLDMTTKKDARVKLRFGTITLVNEHTSPAGTLLADEASYRNISIAVQDKTQMEMSIPLVTLTGAFMVPLKDNASLADKVFANQLRAARTQIPQMNFSFVVKGLSKTFSITDANVTWDGGPDSYSGTTRFTIGKILLDEAMLTGPGGRNPIAIAGYKQIALSLDSSANQKVTGSNMDFAFNMTLRDANKGAILISGAASEVPLAVVEALGSGDQAKLKGAMIQLMGAKIVSFKLRFEDASLTSRVIPIAARALGMPPEALAPNAAAMVQIGLAKLRSPQFTKQVVAAVSAYLKDPKTITAALSPAQPLPGAAVIGMAANPQSLIKALGVSVTAND